MRIDICECFCEPCAADVPEEHCRGADCVPWPSDKKGGET